MPITFAKTYVTTDGQTWPKLEDAQQREIALILAKDVLGGDGKTQPWEAASLAIVQNRDAVLVILKQKERKRTRAAKPKRVPRTASAKPTETVTT